MRYRSGWPSPKPLHTTVDHVASGRSVPSSVFVSSYTRVRAARLVHTWRLFGSLHRNEPVAVNSSDPRGARRTTPVRFMVVSSLGDERCLHGESRVSLDQESEGGVSARALALRSVASRELPGEHTRAFADGAADRLRSQVERGRDPASGAGCKHPISLAKSARRPASISRVIPIPDGGREHVRCPVAIDAARKERRTGSASSPRGTDVARTGQRGHSAALETPTRPRAPGKVGSPTELTVASGVDDEPR